jgi:hypothetical protein
MQIIMEKKLRNWFLCIFFFFKKTKQSLLCLFFGFLFFSSFFWKFIFYSVEGSEGELALCAGDYLLVWGNGEPQGGYYDAELLDGRRGLVPASFVQRLIGNNVLYIVLL